MPMNHTGLAKLIEECGEVVQVAGKMLALPAGATVHWDGGIPLDERLENELADLYAAITFVIYRRKLNYERLTERAERKLTLFDEWEANENS